ncbi:hypothetical protein [Acidimangrovimonas sediminis]|uniref:hypothetical protein n=1 Tax=Acidimangrovimonas sediminis TaxID=2056283 RepID=UPI000C806AAE|nr:hypothetical protein [Acidimangrovimonas sediminis]
MPSLTPHEFCHVHPVAPPSADALWKAEQGHAHSVFTEKKARITKAVASGKNAKVKGAVREFLRCDQVRLSASLRALGGTPEREAAMLLRDHVHAWKRDYAPIGWGFHAKSTVGVRPICKRMPLDLKAVHHMLAAALEAQFAPSVPLYGVRGHSRDDAARALKELQASGFPYLAKTDIRDCFQQVNPDALYRLPLPKEVIKHALDTRNLVFEELGGQQANGASFAVLSSQTQMMSHVANGPRGLMQGSPASGVILAWMLNDIPAGTDQAVLLCNDNIVVAAAESAASREMVDTLFAYFRRHPAGPFALFHPVYADNAPLEFLGYLFDPERGDIGIAEKGRAKLDRRLDEADEADTAELHRRVMRYRDVLAMPGVIRPPSPFTDCYPVEHWRALRDFRSGFSAADTNGDELAFYLAMTADTAERRGEAHVARLHHHLFAGRDTFEGTLIRGILNHHPRRGKAQ